MRLLLKGSDYLRAASIQRNVVHVLVCQQCIVRGFGSENKVRSQEDQRDY